MCRCRYPLVLIAILFGGVARFATIGQHGIWADEKTTITSATGFHMTDTLQHRIFSNLDYRSREHIEGVIPSSIRNSGGNALGHNLVLGLWGRLFGYRDGVIRSFSALAGLAIIALAALFFVRHVLPQDDPSPVALGMLLALVVVHPLLLGYSQSVRSYSFATCCCLAATLLFFSYLERPGHLKVILYLFTMLFCLTLHYFTFTVFASHAVLILIFRKRFLPAFRLYRKYLIGSLLVFVLSTPLLYHGLNLGQIMHRSTAYGDLASHGDPMRFAMPASPLNIAKGIGQYLLVAFGLNLQDLGLQVRDTILVLIVPFIAFRAYFRKIQLHVNSPGVLFCIVVVAAYLLQAIVLSVIGGHIIPFQNLYQIFAVPFALCLLALCLGALRNKPLKVASFAIIVAINLAGGFAILQDTPKDRSVNPYMEAADSVSASYQGTDTVIINSWPDSRLFNLYLSSDERIVQKLVPDTIDPQIRLFRNGKVIFETSLKDRRY